MFDGEEDKHRLYGNVKSNYGRKIGEPKLSDDDLMQWSKYYHSTYGQPVSNSFYKDNYGLEANRHSMRQKRVLGKMRELKEILDEDRKKLMDYTTMLEDQHDNLQRMNQDPFYEYLLLKNPGYRDNHSFYPRRKEINERLLKLDAFYGEKLKWSEEQQMIERNRQWLDSYLQNREARKDKPSKTLNTLQQYLDDTGISNRRIAKNYDNLKFRHSKLDNLIAEQKAHIKKLEDRLTQTNEQTERKAQLLRHNFEIEADNLANEIAKEKMLRHSMVPRLPLYRDFYHPYVPSPLTPLNF